MKDVPSSVVFPLILYRRRRYPYDQVIVVAVVVRRRSDYCCCQDPSDLKPNRWHPRKRHYHHFADVVEECAPWGLVVDAVLLDILDKNAPVVLETIFECRHPNSTYEYLVDDPCCVAAYCMSTTCTVDASRFVVVMVLYLAIDVLTLRCYQLLLDLVVVEGQRSVVVPVVAVVAELECCSLTIAVMDSWYKRDHYHHLVVVTAAVDTIAAVIVDVDCIVEGSFDR